MVVSMVENRRAVAAWSAGVSVVASAFATIIASRATTSLSRNVWFIACLAVALITFAIMLTAGVPDLIGWLRDRKDKPAPRFTLAAAQLRDHFEPRARGILPSQVREGSYFTGRVKVLKELSSWVAQSDSTDYRARVVTGAPGSGKSAVLGRLIGLASPRLRGEWTRSDADGAQIDTAPASGLTVTAVHARGRTVDEVAAQIAAGLSIGEMTAAGLLAALRADWQPRPSALVVVDAVDEADKPYQLIVELLEPLVSGASRTRLRLLIGTRRGGGDDLLQLFGQAAVVIDLDTPDYLDIADIQEYARRTLLAESDPRATTPYRGKPAAAAAVARAIAVRAAPSFLIAQLTALSLTEAAQPVDTTAPGWMETFPSTVGAAMELYLRNAHAGSSWLRDLLTALAWAQGDGLDNLQMWAAVATGSERRSIPSATPYGSLIRQQRTCCTALLTATRLPTGFSTRRSVNTCVSTAAGITRPPRPIDAWPAYSRGSCRKPQLVPPVGPRRPHTPACICLFTLPRARSWTRCSMTPDSWPPRTRHDCCRLSLR